MSLNDALTRFTASLSVNAPYLALDDARVLVLINSSVLAEYVNLDAQVQNVSANLSYKTATGQALIDRGNDFAVPYNRGQFSGGTGVFSVGSPAAASSVIRAGTLVGTGDGVITPVYIYQTLADAIINAGATTSTTVAFTAQQTGAAYNQAIGQVNQMLTNVGNGVTFANTTAATGGADADTDQQYRDRIEAQLAATFSPARIEAAILAAGAYDAYVNPAPVIVANQYTFNYYWCDANGAQPTGLAGTNGPIALAVAAQLPPGLTGVSNAFTVISYNATQNTTIHITYSAPASVLSSTIDPQIQTAVKAYLQGDGVNARSGLVHNLVPDPFSLGIAVQQGYNPQTGLPVVGGGIQSLTSFAVTAFNPAVGSPSPTTIYRLTGPINNGAGSTVLLTRL